MSERVKIDWLFVDQQLNNSDVTGEQNLLVRKILHVFDQVGITYDDAETLPQVLDTVTSLLMSQPIVAASGESWVDAVPGYIAKGDRVRVKTNAYVGPAGLQHNGKVGRVTTLRNGKVAVVYDGESPDTAPQHEVLALQKLV